VLPLFAGIYKRGAGLGPAIAFLYSGPAINILAIILTARVLGIQLGLARAIGAILFSVIIGFVMHLLFLKEERAKMEDALVLPQEENARPLWKTAIYVAVMIAILVFVNWGKPGSIEIETVQGQTILATRAGETADTILYKLNDDASTLSVSKSDVVKVSYPSSCVVQQGRSQGVGRIELVVRQADLAVPIWRCAHCWLPPRASRTPGTYPF